MFDCDKQECQLFFWGGGNICCSLFGYCDAHCTLWCIMLNMQCLSTSCLSHRWLNDVVFRTQPYKPTLFTSWIPPCWSQQAFMSVVQNKEQPIILLIMLQICPIGEFLSVLVLFLSIILHLKRFILRLNQVKTYLKPFDWKWRVCFSWPIFSIRLTEAQDDIARIV